ncbi:MD-2-related lipid-recognition domain-containing protein [Plasmodiophora brassicae]|uniref:MD-2-related lipid-recognition domain-containing protein n=1 Tax=Plasmodiophora brassicae TaxID=37360 RepID=A0A0G4J4U3_PLABS|nr:hypothetical protein PBRA_002565 [Plasmodiophora brassicae]SPQ94732.1 unnamed protein product [Plasmodiophora brassicae]
MAYWLVITLAVLSGADAFPIPFSSCAGNQADDASRLVIKSIDISPYPVKPGGSALANIGLSIKKKVDHGSHYDLKIYMDKYELVHESGDLCALSATFTCPKDADDSAVLQYKFQFPRVPFAGSLRLHLMIWNQNNQELCCVDFSIDVRLVDGKTVMVEKDYLMEEVQKLIDEYSGADM